MEQIAAESWREAIDEAIEAAQHDLTLRGAALAATSQPPDDGLRDGLRVGEQPGPADAYAPGTPAFLPSAAPGTPAAPLNICHQLHLKKLLELSNEQHL